MLITLNFQVKLFSGTMIKIIYMYGKLSQVFSERSVKTSFFYSTLWDAFTQQSRHKEINLG